MTKKTPGVVRCRLAPPPRKPPVWSAGCRLSPPLENPRCGPVTGGHPRSTGTRNLDRTRWGGFWTIFFFGWVINSGYVLYMWSLLYILLSHMYCACCWCTYSHSRVAPTYFGYLLYNVPTADICIYVCASDTYVVIYCICGDCACE